MIRVAGQVLDQDGAQPLHRGELVGRAAWLPGTDITDNPGSARRENSRQLNMRSHQYN